MNDYPTTGTVERQIESPYRWIDDDCIVRECDIGLIHVDDGVYITAFKCPTCRRWPNPQYPKTYEGTVSYHTEAEIRVRREERKEAYFNQKRPRIPKMSEVGI